MKMNKSMLTKIVWVLVLVFCLSAVSCTCTRTKDDGFCTVSFDYGYSDKVLTEKVMRGGYLAEPDTPIRIDCEFDGWWIKDEDVGERLWNFEKDAVTKDLTLYARWIETGGAGATHTLILDPTGGVCDVDSFEVTYGEEYSLPIPRKEGYYFLYWHEMIPNEGTWIYPFSELRAPLLAVWQNFPAGMTIKMGTFEQDNDLTNGEEEIEWDVVSYKDGKYFVVSKYILYAMEYCEKPADRSWDNSFVRKWLNEEFLENHFTDDEKKYIEYTEIDDGPTDKMVSLAGKHVRKEIVDKETVNTELTPYAQTLGIPPSGASYETIDGTIYYLTPYFLTDGIAYSRTRGVSPNIGAVKGIRPAMTISEEYLEKLS